jgi:hypothetical protein
VCAALPPPTVAPSARVAAAWVVLLVLAAPGWPDQLDDQLITLAYAHSFAADGLLRWGTGATVEGFSSFSQLSLAAGWTALGGADANVFVKILGGLAAFTLVAYAARRIPGGVAGALLLAALVGWEPSARWVFVGMETSLYALLLTVGWAGVLGAPPGVRAGLGALWLAAPTHPEGNLHFALAALVAARDRATWPTAAALGTALAAFHGLRVAYFGALLPTPYLVKIAANEVFGDQWLQIGGELLTLVGVGGAAAMFRGHPAAWLPLVVQVGLALRAEADWMGHARHIFPGVWASAVAWGATSAPRSFPARRAALLLVIVGAASLFQPPDPFFPRPHLREGIELPNPLAPLARSLDTTQREDVERLVTTTPAGGTVLLEDVGMPGNIPDVRVLDIVGLTDRDVARANAGDRTAEAALEARLRRAPDRPVLARRMVYGEGEPARPIPWIPLPKPQHVPYPQGTALWYRLSPEQPSADTVSRRWAALHDRYPSQGPVAWYHAMHEAAEGRLPTGVAVAERMGARFPSDPLTFALRSALFAPFPMESYAEPPRTLRQFSRPVRRGDVGGLAVLLRVDPDLDQGQLVRLSWSCGGEAAVVRTQGFTRAALPAWTCAEDTARLRVEAVDDRPRRLLPESLLVGFARLPVEEGNPK